MCGLSVLISSNSLKYSDLISLNQPIEHRGPDDEGYLIVDEFDNLEAFGGNSTPLSVYNCPISYTPISQNENEDLNIKFGMAHRRLSILDLSENGHLPMSFNNRYWITYNGEVYNYLEIKSELVELGYKFKTETDTEVILASYIEWGNQCLSKFIGMWAFIIFDSETNKLFASRDRFGIKPLYFYTAPSGDLFFTSEIKQILNLSKFEPKLNFHRALDFLNYGFTDHTNETMFQDIFIFPASHFCEFNINDIPNKILFTRYYALNEGDFEGTFESACSDFKKLFESSIELQLRADVEIGSALSGGLDSTSIVSAINQKLTELNKTNIQKTFSSCSQYVDFSEEKWINIVKNELKLNSFICYPNIENLEEELSELLFSLDEPSQSMSAFLGSKVFSLAQSQNIKVLINGQGADEYLGGYGQFANLALTCNLKKLYLKSFIENIRAIHKYKNLSFLNIFKGLFIHIIKFSFSRVKKSKYINVSKEILNNYSHPFSNLKHSNFSKRGIIQNQLYSNALPRYLRWEDRNSMRYSIEARVPFLDHRLVDFVASLPVSFLEKRGISKLLMRDSLSNFLPEAIKNRKDKKGFITPEEQWVKIENPELFRKLLKKSITYSNGILNENILEYFDNMIKGNIPFDYTYLRFIQFGFWMKAFKINNAV